MLRTLRLATLAALLPLLGCDSGGGTTGTTSVTGSYSLTQVNSSPLPHAFAGSYRVLAGSLILNSDGTQRQNVTIDRGAGTNSLTYSYTGGYTMSGDNLAMSFRETDEGYRLPQATVSGRTLTGRASQVGLTFTYRK